MNMTIAQARRILRTETLDLKELRTIYLKRAQHCHPDVMTGDSVEWNQVIDAYDVLRTYIDAQPCKYCGDTGVEVVQKGFIRHEVTCKHCSK